MGTMMTLLLAVLVIRFFLRFLILGGLGLCAACGIVYGVVKYQAYSHRAILLGKIIKVHRGAVTFSWTMPNSGMQTYSTVRVRFPFSLRGHALIRLCYDPVNKTAVPHIWQCNGLGVLIASSGVFAGCSVVMGLLFSLL